MKTRWALPNLLTALFVSGLGDHIAGIALPWIVLVETGSATQAAAVVVAEMLGIAVAGLPGGWLADRVGPRKTILATDAARVLIFTAIAWVVGSQSMSVAALVLLAFAAGACSSPVWASIRSLLGSYSSQKRGSSAMSLFEMVSRMSVVIGFAVGGILVAVIGAQWTLFINAVSFVLSYALVLALPDSTLRVKRTRPMLAGVRAIVTEPVLAAWTLAIPAFEVTWRLLGCALPVLVLLRYDGGAGMNGMLFGVTAAGCFIGSVISYGMLRSWSAMPVSVVVRVVQLGSFWILLIPLPLHLLVAALFFAGICNGAVCPAVAAVIYERSKSAVRLQIFTIMAAAEALVGAVGLAIGGVVTDVAGPYWTMVMLVGFQTAGSAVFVAAGIRSWKSGISHRVTLPMHSREMLERSA